MVLLGYIWTSIKMSLLADIDKKRIKQIMDYPAESSTCERIVLVYGTFCWGLARHMECPFAHKNGCCLNSIRYCT